MSRPLLASRSQLVALRREAQEAGDGEQARLCTLALDGDHDALARCTGVIVEALGNGEPGAKTVASVAELLGLGWTSSALGLFFVTAGDWRVHAMLGPEKPSGAPLLCWHARHQEGTARDKSGSWGCARDIEDTLRALGGVE